MARLVQLIRALGAFVLSALIGGLAAVIGSFLLWRGLTAAFPGGDSIMAFFGLCVGVPLLGIASLVLVVVLTVVFYRKFGGTPKQASSQGCARGV
jgi:membrane protein implicated in regulation of membrane protease activity